MQNDLNLKEWTIDERTGYLRNTIRVNAVTPEQKETFLEGLKTLGNETKAAKLAGFTPRILSAHKRADRKFKEDFDAVLKEMANILEGVMYLHAQDPHKGFMDRMAWLRAHYPNKYNPKFLQNEKDTKKVVDDLWQEIQKEK